MFGEIAKENIGETTKQIRKAYQKQYNSLSPLAKFEFNEAIEKITTKASAKLRFAILIMLKYGLLTGVEA